MAHSHATNNDDICLVIPNTSSKKLVPEPQWRVLAADAYSLVACVVTRSRDSCGGCASVQHGTYSAVQSRFTLHSSSSNTLSPSPPGIIWDYVSPCRIFSMGSGSYHADVVAVQQYLWKLRPSLDWVTVQPPVSPLDKQQTVRDLHLGHIGQDHVCEYISGVLLLARAPASTNTYSRSHRNQATAPRILHRK